MNILGISAFYHDSAAALVSDGEIVGAAQEERFTRIKHDSAFPSRAVDYVLDEAGIRIEDIDFVAFYEKPLLKFERLLETYLAYAPAGFRSFRLALPAWAGEKLFLARSIRKSLDNKRLKASLVYPSHHESHAASAFFPSPFEDAAILTVDGVGEWDTTTLGVGQGNKIKILKRISFPHSLGLLYSAFTYYTGFRVNSGEYKLMGLAPYGEPKFADVIKEHLIDIKEDGSFRLDMRYFNYCQGLTMTNRRFEELLGRERRKAESDIDVFYMDIAASIQKVTEEVVLKLARHAKELSGSNNLVMAGGVALNCVANGKVLSEGIFDDLWIQPAAGDAGGALGAAQFVWYQLLGKERTQKLPDGQNASYLGPAFSREEISAFIDGAGATAKYYEDDELAEVVAALLANESVVGLFQGRMEFGPRALGGRSILGDPRSEEMQKTMNLKIKFRESFRPFAPTVAREYVHEYFDVRNGQDSAYMLLVAGVAESKRRKESFEQIKAARGLDKLYIPRSEVPAITHVDYSARIQTVDERHGVYYKIVDAFRRKTGCPVVINTSFNVRGEPIVGSPEDAYRCFAATNMDALVLGNFILLKNQQTNIPEIDTDAYLSKFALD